MAAEILLMATLNAVIDTIIVLVILSRRTEKMMGVVKVKNSEGETIYAPQDPDGKPIRVPVARQGEDGKVVVTQEYAPLAYSLPTIAAMQLKASMLGKAGKLTQMANEAVLADMPIEAASQAMALQAFAKGQYGRALMAILAPKIAASINGSGNAGRELGGNGRQRGSGPI